jgi:BirA family transcriptional regulator, biotin operon repressor / biotin---[acetyl-CoA-carboxylase] ligase
MPGHDAGEKVNMSMSMTTSWPAENIWQHVMALGLPSLVAFSVEILSEIDSTNTELMRRARAGRTEPTLLVAEQQTAGRGRMGRAWQSSAGDSLTFSLGMTLSPASWEGLSLAVGASVAHSLSLPRDAMGQEQIQLKWPNDLWWQGRKLAGILIETAATAESAAAKRQERFAVIGIGVNIRLPQINLNLTTGLSAPIACHEEIISASSPQTALARLFGPLLTDLLEFERAGFAAFVGRFAALDALVGRDVALSDGVEGRAQGVDGSGALLVHTSAGLQRVASQEVSVRPRTPF